MFTAAITTSLFLAPIVLPLNEISQFNSSTPQTICIYLVRHGESLFNVPDVNGIKYASGKGISVPLTEKGRQQAKDLGKKLIGKLSPDASYSFFSSTAIRAQNTADLVFAELTPYYSIERKESYEEFCELGKGKWEGKPRDDEYNNDAKIWEALSSKEKFYFPVSSTGESYDEVATRFLSGLKKITDEHQSKTIFIATHNAAINALAFKLSGKIDELSEEHSTPFPATLMGNCDILSIELEVGAPIENAQVKTHIISEK